MEFFIGEVVDNRYIVQSLLSSDRIWELYEVLDFGTKLKLSLKVIKGGSVGGKQMARIKNRADKAIDLIHENILSLYSTGLSGQGALYLIQALCDGKTLKQIVSEPFRLAPDDVLSILIQVAQALAYLHQNERSHGSLTGSSVWISEQDGIYHAKLMNFEMDALIGADVSRNWAKAIKSPELVEQALYASPEQAREGVSTVQTDIYSFGCLMYEALTGHPPFEGTTVVEVMRKHIEGEVPRIPGGSPAQRALEHIVRRCLSKNPSDRYKSADELVAELQDIQDGKGSDPGKRNFISGVAFFKKFTQSIARRSPGDRQNFSVMAK